MLYNRNMTHLYNYLWMDCKGKKSPNYPPPTSILYLQNKCQSCSLFRLPSRSFEHELQKLSMDLNLYWTLAEYHIITHKFLWTLRKMQSHTSWHLPSKEKIDLFFTVPVKNISDISFFFKDWDGSYQKLPFFNVFRRWPLLKFHIFKHPFLPPVMSLQTQHSVE